MEPYHTHHYPITIQDNLLSSYECNLQRKEQRVIKENQEASKENNAICCTKTIQLILLGCIFGHFACPNNIQL